MALCSNQVSDDSLDWTQLNLLQQQVGNARFMISKRKGGARQPAAAAAHENEQQQQGQTWEGPELKGIILRCPRCDSSNTKFCYYNNYNRSQPRHICKTCQRHWTQGGTLRNVPVGGSRKGKTHHPKTRTKAKTLPTSLADSVQAILHPLAPLITYEHDIDLDNMLLSHEINDSSNTRSSTNSSGSGSSSSYNASCFTAFPSQTLPPTLLPPLPQLTYSSTMGFGFNGWEWESSFPSFQSDSLSDLATGTINWPDSSTNLLDSTTWNWEDLATLLSSDPTLTHSSFASSSLVTDTFKS